LLSQAQVSAVVVVIANVVSKKSLQMAFVESDDGVEQIAAAASHPTLGNTVLPEALDRGLHASNLQSAKGSGNIQSILLIVVEEKEPGRGLAGKCFAHLLDGPTAGRMRGDIEVQDATPVMANDEKAVEQVEGDSGDSKEVRGGNGCAVIVKKRKLTLHRFRVSGCTAHAAGDRTLRYIEAEHAEFAVDARRTPGGIFNDHWKDQVTDFFGNSLPAAPWVSGLAQHGPVPSESSAVPADNCLGHDEEERLFPWRPELARGDPKELVEHTEFGFGMSALECRQLLPQSKILQQQTAARAK
jgi:hypothetical protein